MKPTTHTLCLLQQNIGKHITDFVATVEGEQTGADAGLDDGGVAVEFEDDEDDENAGGQADEVRRGFRSPHRVYRQRPRLACLLGSNLIRIVGGHGLLLRFGEFCCVALLIQSLSPHCSFLHSPRSLTRRTTTTALATMRRACAASPPWTPTGPTAATTVTMASRRVELLFVCPASVLPGRAFWPISATGKLLLLANAALMMSTEQHGGCADPATYSCVTAPNNHR